MCDSWKNGHKKQETCINKPESVGFVDPEISPKAGHWTKTKVEAVSS